MVPRTVHVATRPRGTAQPVAADGTGSARGSAEYAKNPKLAHTGRQSVQSGRWDREEAFGRTFGPRTEKETGQTRKGGARTDRSCQDEGQEAQHLSTAQNDKGSKTDKGSQNLIKEHSLECSRRENE